MAAGLPRVPPQRDREAVASGWRMVEKHERVVAVDELLHRLDHGDRIVGLETGVDDYITKALDLDLLAGRIDRILARCEESPRGAMGNKTLAGDLDQVSLASLLHSFSDEKRSGVLLLVKPGSSRNVSPPLITSGDFTLNTLAVLPGPK